MSARDARGPIEHIRPTSPDDPIVAAAVAHDHPGGLFCDDCPDALRQNIKRIVVLHQWTNDYYDRDCICGWSMPFKETHQHAAHVADVLATTLTDLGWVRAVATEGAPA